MKCPVCGKKNPDSAAACVSCGSALAGASSLQPAESYGSDSRSALTGSEVQPENPSPGQRAPSQMSPVQGQQIESFEGLRLNSPLLPSLITVVTWAIFAVVLIGLSSNPITLLAVLIMVGVALSIAAISRRSYTFGADAITVTSRTGTRVVRYTDIKSVQLIRNRIFLGLGRMTRGLVIPSNPRRGDSDLYSWLDSRVPKAVESDKPLDTENEGQDSTESKSEL